MVLGGSVYAPPPPGGVPLPLPVHLDVTVDDAAVMKVRQPVQQLPGNTPPPHTAATSDGGGGRSGGGGSAGAPDVVGDDELVQVAGPREGVPIPHRRGGGDCQAVGQRRGKRRSHGGRDMGMGALRLGNHLCAFWLPSGRDRHTVHPALGTQKLSVHVTVGRNWQKLVLGEPPPLGWVSSTDYTQCVYV